MTEEVSQVVEETSSVSSGTVKRKTRGFVCVDALSSKPSIKKYLKQQGSQITFNVGGKNGRSSRTVNRVSGDAVTRLESLARKDNKYARQVAKTAVVIAGAAKKRTVNMDHIRSAEEILKEVC